MDKKRPYRSLRKITMKQSPSYFTPEQLHEMKVIGEKMNIKIAQLRRDSLDYFFSKINQEDFKFKSVEDPHEKMVLANGWFTPEQISKCKKIAEEHNVSSGQIRRDAWDIFYKSLSEKKINFYESNKESFL